MNSAILLIDIQNEYFPGGTRELHRPEQAVARARQALEYFRGRGLPVFHVQHINTQDGSTSFLPGSIGAQIHESVCPQAGETVIEKHFPSAFLQTNLSDELQKRDIRHLVVCGMMSHMCIDTSVRAAQDYGLSVTVLEDACTTRDLVWAGETIPAEMVHNTIMASLNGMFAKVMRTDEFLESA